MEKVYVLFEVEEVEVNGGTTFKDEIFGIFSTKELAEAAKADYIENGVYAVEEDLFIDEIELGKYSFYTKQEKKEYDKLEEERREKLHGYYRKAKVMYETLLQTGKLIDKLDNLIPALEETSESVDETFHVLFNFMNLHKEMFENEKYTNELKRLWVECNTGVEVLEDTIEFVEDGEFITIKCLAR